MPSAQLSSFSFTPDLAILGILAVCVIYGLVLGHNKLKTFALSVYVGMVLGEAFGAPLAQFLSSRGWDGGGVFSPAVVGSIIFLLPLLLLEGGKTKNGRGRPRGGMFMTLALCALTAGLVVAGGLQIMPDGTREAIADQSWLATFIYKYRLWFIASVPLAVIGETYIFRSRDH